MTTMSEPAVQYGELYDIMLRHSSASWIDRSTVLEHIGTRMRIEDRARTLDMGAGGGDGAAWLLGYLPRATLIAADPNPLCLQRLARRFHGDARATIVETTVERWLRTSADTGFDFILLLSMLYHVPLDTWAEVITRLTDRLSPSGVAVVTMKDPASGCNQLVRHFGGQPLDITSFFETYHPPDRHVVHMMMPTRVETDSLEELERILRFMLADVALEQSVSSEAIRAYAAEHFDRGDGRWEVDIPEHLYVVTRDAATAHRIAEGGRFAARPLGAGRTA